MAVPHNGTDTSKAAAESMEPHLGRLQQLIHDYYDSRRWYGATCDEAEAALEMRHQTCSARVKELRDKGLLVDSGERRKTRSHRSAAVYVLKQYAPKKDTCGPVGSADSQLNGAPTIQEELPL